MVDGRNALGNVWQHIVVVHLQALHLAWQFVDAVEAATGVEVQLEGNNCAILLRNQLLRNLVVTVVDHADFVQIGNLLRYAVFLQFIERLLISVILIGKQTVLSIELVANLQLGTGYYGILQRIGRSYNHLYLSLASLVVLVGSQLHVDHGLAGLHTNHLDLMVAHLLNLGNLLVANGVGYIGVADGLSIQFNSRTFLYENFSVHF